MRIFFTIFSVIICFFALSSSVLSGAVEQWSCRNETVEIGCSDTTCTVSGSGDFTPMTITVDASSISACMYTGCYEGEAKVLETEKTIYFLGENLKWSERETDDATIQIAIEKDSNIGFMIGVGYAHPMSCGYTD